MRVPLTTRDFLDRAAVVFRDRPGVVDEPGAPDGLGTLTYGEHAARARGLAAGLDALGVGIGERVACVTPNSARMLELFSGTTGWGRVLVPVNFRLSCEEVAYIVEHSGSSVLLVDPELDDALKTVATPHRFVLGAESDEALVLRDHEPAPWQDPDEDATATINYTSGTTARPKGVELTHRNIYLNALTFGLHAGVSERDVYLHTLPMFHANGWGMPFVATGLGVPQVVLRKVDGTEILHRVREHGVTYLCAAPAVVASVLAAAEEWDGEIPGRDRVRVICAGAPPPSRTLQRIEEDLGWEPVQIYGLTETSPLLTINRRTAADEALPPEERASRLSRAGAPAIGVTLRVSEDGEVLARSNVVLKSYWDQPEETEAALGDGWFHTGDGGSVDDEGVLTIADRRKDVIITGGENVSSIEVEDRLHRHEAVADVAVIGVPDDRWGETIAALVVLEEGASVTEQELIAFCKEGLARYKAPTRVEFRDALPRTATGKVQKYRLRQPYWEGRERQVSGG